MTVIVEDGTIVAGANSYVSVGYLDSYHEERDNADWLALSLAKKEAAAIKGTDFVDASYVWEGAIASDEQDLGFPRVGVYDNEGRLIPSDEVPEQLKRAVAFAAGQIGTGELDAAVAAAASAGAIKRKKVATLEIEYFEGGATTSATPALSTFARILSMMLRGLYVAGPGGISGKVVRWS